MPRFTLHKGSRWGQIEYKPTMHETELEITPEQRAAWRRVMRKVFEHLGRKSPFCSSENEDKEAK